MIVLITEANDFIEVLKKRVNAKKREGRTVREYRRVRGNPQASVPPKNAASWIVASAYKQSARHSFDSSGNSSGISDSESINFVLKLCKFFSHSYRH